jgi:hypothetical protein
MIVILYIWWITLAKCSFCGAEIELPYKCNYCGKLFCEVHRLLENHDCAYAPSRTPLGSYQSKQMMAYEKKKREIEKVAISVWNTKEVYTYGNIYGHHFVVPTEVYLDGKYRDKLNKARTLHEVENILRDYNSAKK